MIHEVKRRKKLVGIHLLIASKDAEIMVNATIWWTCKCI